MVLKIWRKLIRTLILLIMRAKQGLRIGNGVIFNGYPLIEITKDAEVIIGPNCTINSSNKGYHLNMFSPVKLMADRVGAKIRIGNNTRIHGSCIHAYELVEIGNRCLIAANCQITDCNGHELSFENVANRINTTSGAKPVIIEDDVWICAGTTVLSGVRIGRSSVISAGSVVTKSVPPFCLYGGTPAKVIKIFEPALNKVE